MEQLEEIFYDPKQGYSNARELFQKAKQSRSKLEYDEVKKWESVRKTLDQCGFVPACSVYKIAAILIKNNKYELSKGKSYYEEELIEAKEGEDLCEFKRKHKEARNRNSQTNPCLRRRW